MILLTFPGNFFFRFVGSYNPLNQRAENLAEAEQPKIAPKQPPKRRKIPEPQPQPRRNVSAPIEKQVTVPVAQTSSRVGFSSSIQQARDFAVAQAQQDGALGNFKIFDSHFGNFLVPVIPTAKELADA